MQAFLSVAQWSIANYEQALERMTELRDQRVELKQVQEDLLQANNEMARMADRLRALHQAAEDARRTKEEFVANISHELRTPLNMIIGFSEMITQSPRIYSTDLPTTLLADITAIQRNSQHLARLVDDVLDLSQVEAGRMAVTKEWVPLRDIAEAAALAVRPLYQSKALALKVDMPDLPMVFCDGTRIRQVILNLLSNAGRFTERGGVTVSARHEGDNIVVSVSDTGPGIKPEDQKRLFEPFQQLDSSLRRKHGGSGLGLTISRRFVEMHNGRMWLDSTVGVGTTISFSLPVSQAPKATLAGEDWRRWFNPYRAYDERTRRSKATAPAPAPRYVVVEPHNTLHRLFARYASDIEIMPVATIAEAVSELDRTPATVVVVNAPLHTDTLSVRAGQ
jgi:signal transduction histidine kinase